MNKKFFYACCIAAIAMSCTQNADEAFSDISEPNTKESDIVTATITGDSTGLPISSTTENKEVLQSGSPVIDWDKKIIKNAHVTLELNDYNIFNTALHNKLKGYGAYIAQEQQTESDDQIANSLAIKVPVERFDDLMNSLAGDGVKILEKTVSSEDVTGQVIDTKARIEAKKEVRARYIELLRQSKSMKDVLEVQREINGIQEDIEAASGRVNYLNNASAYSTINLRYYQFLNGADENTLEPGFMSKIANAFETGGKLISGLLLFLISIWPFVVGGSLLFVYVRKLRAKKPVVQMPTSVKNAQGE